MMIYAIVLLAVISRFIPHAANFAPITAVAIFSAANMEWKKAAGVTLAARFISDLFLGFFSWPLMLAVYLAHGVGLLWGLWIKKSKNHKPVKIAASTIGSSVIFFLVTNFAFLYSAYPHNFAGVIQAYANGLPFLKGTMLGDMFYTVFLFGGYSAVKNLLLTIQKYKISKMYSYYRV